MYDVLKADHGPNFTAATANMSVYKASELIANLKPARAVYTASGKAVSEVDIHRTLAGDLYLALTDLDSSSKLINLRILIKPLINWIWIGSTVMIVGAVLVLTSYHRRKVISGD